MVGERVNAFSAVALGPELAVSVVGAVIPVLDVVRPLVNEGLTEQHALEAVDLSLGRIKSRLS